MLIVCKHANIIWGHLYKLLWYIKLFHKTNKRVQQDSSHGDHECLLEYFSQMFVVSLYQVILIVNHG